MFISASAIKKAIQDLSNVHVFFGTSYLVLKKLDAPVGSTIPIALDAGNNEHLKKYFRLHPQSNCFFFPFNKKQNDSYWRKKKYASTSLQAINTQAFEPAIIHPKNVKEWGWRTGYEEFLKSKLIRQKKLPLGGFAIWFSKEDDFSDTTDMTQLIGIFCKKFHLSEQDIISLFDDNSNDYNDIFCQTRPSWKEVIKDFEPPPDVPLETGACLRFLKTSGIGPLNTLQMTPGERINIITGDNGLGKSFLLDTIWLTLTQKNLDQQIIPLGSSAIPVFVDYIISCRKDGKYSRAEFKNSCWKFETRKQEPGLIAYARVDGSFAIYDPCESHTILLDRNQIWFGGGRETPIEGLLRDWVKWQMRKDEFRAFDIFREVFKQLKPPEMNTRDIIGKPTRVKGYSMDIPTIQHTYGIVPVVFESAGMRRILSLAYLLVWVWEEHRIKAKQAGRKEESQMVLLIDEAEAHLHPKWQRVFLDSLVQVSNILKDDLTVQYFISSHSPALLTYAEDIWEADYDKLFYFNLQNDQVMFCEGNFEKYGSLDAWTQSVFFDYLSSRSKSAEQAIQEAVTLMNSSCASTQDIINAHQKLCLALPPEDSFWHRWLPFTVRKGVSL